MSRTDAHVPYWVEHDQAPAWLHSTRSGLHRTEILAGGRTLRACIDPHCCTCVPRWASTQPWERRGTAAIERRAAVRDRLRAAAREYRTTGEVLTDVMPDPVTHCLCEMCGVR